MHSDPRISSQARLGIGVVEVVIAILGLAVLAVLLLPTMQRMRERARRNHCSANLVKVHLALAAYYSDHAFFPAGVLDPSSSIESKPDGYHHNWLIGVLPMLGRSDVAELVDSEVGVYASQNEAARSSEMAVLHCPSAMSELTTLTSYAGICSSIEAPISESVDGVFRLNRPTTEAEIKDGLSFTAFVAEKLALQDDLGWMSGTRASLRNGAYPINAPEWFPETATQDLSPKFVGGIGSRHAGGAHLLFGDGTYQFLNPALDVRVLQQMCAVADASEMDETADQEAPASERPSGGGE